MTGVLVPPDRRVRGQLPPDGGEKLLHQGVAGVRRPGARDVLQEVLTSLYDTRVPLARLFLWVQVIHSFDVPARKDLPTRW